jgi:hypothetical protein
MNDVRRKGKFFKRVGCSHSWLYVRDHDWHYGFTYYKWCNSCDRFERLGLIYNCSWPEDKEKDMREMGIPENYEFIPYVSHPDHDDWPDLIKRREDLGFAKPWGT